MTNSLSEAHVESSTPQKTVEVELLDHGGITLHWDELVSAVRASVPGCTERTVANVMLKVRAKRIQAWAVWIGEYVHAVLLTQPTNSNYADNKGLFIIALLGNDMSLDDWKIAIDVFRRHVKSHGIKKIGALTTVPRIVEIVNHSGWKTTTLCELEV